MESIWQRLAARAETLSYSGAAPADRSEDPALRLMLGDGRTLSRCWVVGGQYSFQIPSGMKAVRLLSHSIRPSDSTGPFVDDRRQLVVAVMILVPRQGLDGVMTTTAGIGLPGWQATEGDVCWTDGAALLALPATDGPAVLRVRVVATLSYRLPAAGQDALAAA